MTRVLRNVFRTRTSESLFLGARIATPEFFPAPSGVMINVTGLINLDLLLYCKLYHIKCDKNQIRKTYARVV